VRRCQTAGDLHWPAGVDADREVEALARRLEPDHGTALAKGPALEDVTRISRETARRLKEVGALDDPVAGLALKEGPVAGLVSRVGEAFGADRKTFAGE